MANIDDSVIRLRVARFRAAHIISGIQPGPAPRLLRWFSPEQEQEQSGSVRRGGGLTIRRAAAHDGLQDISTEPSV